VLVPAEPADELVEVSLPSGRTRITRVGDQPHDAAGLDGRVFVGDEFSSTLTAVQDGRRQRTATVDAQPGGVVSTGEKIGVISVLAYTIELFDPETLRGEGSRNAGIGPTHAVADGDGRIYIADTRGDAVIVYATKPRLKWVGRIELPGSPYGLAVDTETDRVWVTLTARNEVVELAGGDQPKRLRSFPTVRQPNTVAVEPGSGRVYVASRTDGTLQLIDAGG
jgi:DNA-binding beta-propeller fold protein YncE